jgi:hypothetical protein
VGLDNGEFWQGETLCALDRDNESNDGISPRKGHMSQHTRDESCTIQNNIAITHQMVLCITHHHTLMFQVRNGSDVYVKGRSAPALLYVNGPGWALQRQHWSLSLCKHQNPRWKRCTPFVS